MTMPLYFFDVRDKQGLHRDDTGLEFDTLDDAIAEGRRALGDMSREALDTGGDGDLEITIRDHTEGPVKLALSLTTELPPDDKLS